MDILNTKIKNILTEKNTKIIPENLKKDITIFNITGTYEGSGGASEYNAKVVTTPIITSYTQFPNVMRFIKEFPAVDLTGFTTCQSFFMNCNYLEKVELFDTSNCTSFDNMFNNCFRLKSIPQFNTSKGTTFKNFCGSCENLEDVPILDTSKATPYGMSNMFQGCNSLTNESLNNILYMCAHVGSGSAYRTLAYIGLSSAQATTCQTLSNWSAAEAAGWTTGY